MLVVYFENIKLNFYVRLFVTEGKEFSGCGEMFILVTAAMADLGLGT